MTLVYILAAIFIFGVLVAVHEFGHFITAKLCGVRSMSFPSAWARFSGAGEGETQYSWRLFPCGLLRHGGGG